MKVCFALKLAHYIPPVLIFKFEKRVKINRHYIIGIKLQRRCHLFYNFKRIKVMSVIFYSMGININTHKDIDGEIFFGELPPV